MNDLKSFLKKLETFKYPLLLLLVGIVLMLLPTKEGKADGGDRTEISLETVLGDTAGVGRVRVIVSEKGAVIVCDGAANASVRLDVLHAVASYTGFGADRVTVLKMTDWKGR